MTKERNKVFVRLVSYKNVTRHSRARRVIIFILERNGTALLTVGFNKARTDSITGYTILS